MTTLHQSALTPSTSVMSENTASTNSGSIAVVATPLMSTVTKRIRPTNKPKCVTVNKPTETRLADLYHTVSESQTTPGDISATLRAARTAMDHDPEDTTTFGMIDDMDQIVRITVPTDQAKGFERELQRLLSINVDNNDSLSDVVFALKDRFTIVDLVWPTIPAEDEETVNVAGSTSNDEPTVPGDNPDVVGDDPNVASVEHEQATSLLSQILGMMQADAAARKAEADAKEAEAHAREAEVVLAQASTVAHHEEEMLDMEAEQKARLASEKEATRLARLSQWKRDVDSDGSGETK